MGSFLLFLLRLAFVVPTSTHATAHAATTTSTPITTDSHAHAHEHAVRTTADTAARGADISWPNCPKGEGIPGRRSKGEPLPRRNASFVIVGLTNGPGFYPNPCITDQVTWVAEHRRSLGVYAMTTFPSKAQLRFFGTSGPYAATSQAGLRRNAGYAEAKYNLRIMHRLRLHNHLVWVDVEPYPTNPWTSHRLANRDVITGAIRAYHDAGHKVGIYTYLNGWHQVVGNWSKPNLPTWATIGSGNVKQALKMCSHGPSGGPTWISQWYTTHRDFDVTCPAAPDRSQLFQ